MRRRRRFPGAGGGRPEAPAPKNFSQGHPKVKFSKIFKNPKNPKNFFSATLNIFSRSSKVKFLKSSKKHRGACRMSSATLKTTLKVTQGQIFQKFKKSAKTPKIIFRDLEIFSRSNFEIDGEWRVNDYKSYRAARGSIGGRVGMPSFTKRARSARKRGSGGVAPSGVQGRSPWA